MRKYMTLLESAYTEPMESKDMSHDEMLDEGDLDMMEADADAEAPAMDDEVDNSLEGSLDIRSLVKMLPDVTDTNRFMNAVRKVQKGDVASLSMMETRELAHGFISLLKDDSTMTMKVLQKIKGVHSRAPEMDM
jgi:hypothetical protein